MRRFILSAVMIVTALIFTLDANAQNEKKEVMQKKTERTTKLAKRGDVKKVDAMTAATAKTEQAEKKCDGCKKADGQCPKAKAEAEKK